jgi:hypothetical protein
MSNQRVVAIALVGGGLIYLWKSGAFDALFGRSTVAPDNDALFRSLTPEQQAFVIAETQAGIALRETQQQELVNAPLRGGGGALTYTIAGATTAFSVASAIPGAVATGVTGSLALTGYGAAAALLVWGITRKGWFRGGEEGVYVNPARDDFTDVWVCVFFGDPKSFTRAEIQQVRYEAMVKSFVDAGVPNEFISPTIARLYAADTMKEFESAATNYLDVLKNKGSNINWINAPAGTPIVCVSRTGTMIPAPA